MGILEFIREHFVHVLPILIAGAFSLAIILERTRALFMVYPFRNSDAFFEKITELLLLGKTGEAVALCDRYATKPLPSVVKAALVRAHLPEAMIERGIQYAVGEVTHMIQKRTSFLATIANVATLLGLFGTIAGLISSFEAVGQADPQQKSALLSAGIATAMNATMMGLAVAIPSMIAFSFLVNRSNRLIAEIENSAIRTLEVLQQRFYTADEGSMYGDDGNWETPANGSSHPRKEPASRRPAA